MPFIKPVGIVPYVDSSVLSEFSYKAISFRPESPWIKRCEHGVKFTEEIKSTIEFELEDSKPLYLTQDQFEKMKDECNAKVKAKSCQSMVHSLDCSEIA